MMWTRDEAADRRIRRMLNSYARAQYRGAYDRPLLEFTGMLAEEFEMWTTRGLVSDRNLRCLCIRGSGHKWLTAEQAKAEPSLAFDGIAAEQARSS
jgi:hypothetical protein